MLPAHDPGICRPLLVNSRPTTNSFWGSENKTSTKPAIANKPTPSGAKESWRQRWDRSELTDEYDANLKGPQSGVTWDKRERAASLARCRPMGLIF